MAYYFSKKQDTALNLNKIKANLRGSYLEFYTGSGVFSKDKVDKGTELLINSAVLKDKWKVLDLGCGYGVVGIVAKKLFPKTIVMMADVNKRAVKLAKMNLELNRVEGYVLRSDLFEKIKGKFDTIIVNPPQKAGKDVCFNMIEESKEHLLENGLLQLVARHNVGGKTLAKKMGEVFGNVEVLAKKGGYRVYVSKLKDF